MCDNVKLVNVPALAGQLVTAKQTFGRWRRYAVYAVHTRFDAVEWFVADAETVDPVTNGPAIIRQAPTRSAAMEGLE